MSLRRSVIGSLRSVSPFTSSNNLSDHSSPVPRTTLTLDHIESIAASQNGRQGLLKRSVTISPTPESTRSRMSSVTQVPLKYEPFPSFADYERDIDLEATTNSRALDTQDMVFERLLQIHPAMRDTTNALSQLPVSVRRRIYGFCFPFEERKLTLSPFFATKAVFPKEFFASPWDILELVTGGIQSFSMLRKELLVYFWTEYQFHVTLNEFSGPRFSPLSHVWLLQYTPIVQRITIEVDFTKFGCSQLKDAREFGYKLNKTKHLLDSIVCGMGSRPTGSMIAQLHLMCRRYSGFRDLNDATVDSLKERYCPNSVLGLCDSLIHLRGMLYQFRVSGFPNAYSIDLLDSIFLYEKVVPEYIIPEDNAWPFVPPLLILPELPKLQPRTSEPQTPVSFVSMEYRQLRLQQSRSLFEEMEDEMSLYSTSPKSPNYALSPQIDDSITPTKVEGTINSSQSSSFALSPIFHDRHIHSKEEDASTSSYALSPLCHEPEILLDEHHVRTSPLAEEAQAYQGLLPDIVFPKMVLLESPTFGVPMTSKSPSPAAAECIRTADPESVPSSKIEAIMSPRTPEPPSISTPEYITPAGSESVKTAKTEAWILPHTPEPRSTSMYESTTPVGSKSTQPANTVAILLPRTPASKSLMHRAFIEPSPRTPNRMNQLNEQDPAFIRTLNAMRSLDGAHTLRHTMIASPKTPNNAGSAAGVHKSPITKRKYMSFVNRLRGCVDGLMNDTTEGPK